MKTFILIFAALFAIKKVVAQNYYTHPGIDKFAGLWRHINGQDTILLTSVVRYVGSAAVKVKAAQFYYTYKQGNSIIWNNYSNVNDDSRADFGASRPYGVSLDTMEYMGRDKLKRKTDEGYVTINAAGNQPTFVRDIGISGGGLSHSVPGEGPLPGYTLPDTIIFAKFVLSEEKGSPKDDK